MSLPPLTAGQRTAGLEKAVEVRRVRADLKNRLKAGAVTLPDVLKQGATDEVIAKTPVASLVKAMPGVGPVRARQIMARLGIDVKRRVRGLGPLQLAALKREFAAA
jgi:hypothetical protein